MSPEGFDWQPPYGFVGKAEFSARCSVLAAHGVSFERTPLAPPSLWGMSKAAEREADPNSNVLSQRQRREIRRQREKREEKRKARSVQRSGREGHGGDEDTGQPTSEKDKVCRLH